MRKVELDSKSPKSDEAFFEAENSGENKALKFAKCGRALKFEENNSPGEPDSSFMFLKRIFFYLPGTFILFYMSFGAAIIFLEIVAYRRKIELLPDDFLSQFTLIGFIIFLGAVMTWFGLGDLKNRKHFVIPASIFVIGATLGALAKAAASLTDFADRMLDDFTGLIYLFPLALVVPILAKGFVDRQTSDSKNA